MRRSIKRSSTEMRVQTTSSLAHGKFPNSHTVITAVLRIWQHRYKYANTLVTQLLHLCGKLTEQIEQFLETFDILFHARMFITKGSSLKR